MRGIIGWRQRIGRTIGYICTIVLISFTSPLTALAEDPPAAPADPAAAQATSPETTAPATPVSPPITAPPDPAPATTDGQGPSGSPGPQQPNGVDASQYTYNESTGVWENDQYTWDPVTKQTKPKTAPEYSYNPATGHWDTTQYVYDPASKAYVPQTVSVDTPPANANITNDDTPQQPTSTSGQALNNQATANSLSNSTNNSNANSSINSDNQSHGIFDLFYNAVISNTMDSTAHTGDAIVAMNTMAGSAVSGSASAIANIVNLLQSSWNTASDAFTTFVSNLFGDTVGDLFLDPGKPADVTSNTTADTTVNISGNSAINNTVNLDASSGNAVVTQNTTGGDATSGNATAVANLVNAINSSIAAHQSFLGVLNIFGNLNGDILMPPELLQSLMAANATGNLNTNQITNTDVLANFTNNETITNNVDATATSGNAAVSNNTSAGNATTGDANTNLTVLNLTGRQVVGKDALLVFVNVLGKWVGMIVNAPAGSTSAALGGDITQNTTNNLEINANNSQSITNDITARATTGDATVSENTHGGNATSGNANTAVNLLNISDSQFSLSDWFGVLFINVFGTWNGSFGMDTAAGTIASPITSTPSPQVLSSNSSDNLPVSEIRAFRFIPSGDGKYAVQSTDPDTATAALASAHVLGDSTRSAAPQQAQHTKDTAQAARNNWWFSALGIIVAASLLGTERVISRRNEK